MTQHIHCPNCQYSGKPARSTSLASLALLLSPFAIGFGVGALGVAPGGFGGGIALAWAPFALAGALLVQGRKCPACGWRHVRPATAEEQSRIPAA